MSFNPPQGALGLGIQPRRPIPRKLKVSLVVTKGLPPGVEMGVVLTANNPDREVLGLRSVEVVVPQTANDGELSVEPRIETPTHEDVLLDADAPYTSSSSAPVDVTLDASDYAPDYIIAQKLKLKVKTEKTTSNEYNVDLYVSGTELM